MGRTPAGQTRERVHRFVIERLMRGQPPTVREVQEALGFRAVQSARAHLEALVREGRLAKRAGQSRGYALPGGTPARLVPVLGRVPAGALKTAVEEREGYVVVQSRQRQDDLFALRVRGESMSGAGILDGDLVIVRRQSVAESGDVVVALVDDEATVKRLRLRAGRAELHPENPAFKPIVAAAGALRLLGKVIEVRRALDARPEVTPERQRGRAERRSACEPPSRHSGSAIKRGAPAPRASAHAGSGDATPAFDVFES